MNLIEVLNAVFHSSALGAAAMGMGASFVFCLLLVLTKRWHGVLTMDSLDGIQKFHTSPTPRIGGVPIVLSLIIAWSRAPEELKHILTPFLMAGMPAFIFGVAEDITKRVGVLQRLLATMASGFLAWWITGYSITHVGVIGMDDLLQFTLVSVLFTALAVGGVANSINIIDGFNGLASTTATLAFIGYAVIAWQVGDKVLAGAGLVIAACVSGFFWMNWPLGKIFLGDGGSYFIGFCLAWVAVLLLERNPEVSAFAALVVCSHPVTEVLFSVFRRKVTNTHPGHPDRLHFHSLVKQRYVRRWFSGFSNTIQNSITGILVGAMTLISILFANFTYDNQYWSAFEFVLIAICYVALYARMVRHSWCSPVRFMLTKPKTKLDQQKQVVK
jgi:UDP-N-acetylmuramyl pentapeptide phosphotransferase/UDP-N-acetylglucosamine-1-phosphate transferase